MIFVAGEEGDHQGTDAPVEGLEHLWEEVPFGQVDFLQAQPVRHDVLDPWDVLCGDGS